MKYGIKRYMDLDSPIWCRTGIGIGKYIIVEDLNEAYRWRIIKYEQYNYNPKYRYEVEEYKE